MPRTASRQPRNLSYIAYTGTAIQKNIGHQRAVKLAEAGNYVQTTEHVTGDDRRNPHFIVQRKGGFLRKAGPRLRVTLEMACWAEEQGGYLIESAGDDRSATRGRQAKRPRVAAR